MPLQDQGMDPASLYIDLLKLSVSEALRPAESALVAAPPRSVALGSRHGCVTEASAYCPSRVTNWPAGSTFLHLS